MATSKARSDHKLQSVDPIWDSVRAEAEDAIAGEPALGGFIFVAGAQAVYGVCVLAFELASGLRSVRFSQCSSLIFNDGTRKRGISANAIAVSSATFVSAATAGGDPHPAISHSRGHNRASAFS